MLTEYRFRRVHDYATIQGVMTNEKIYRAMADDFSPPREKFRARLDDEIWYVGCWKQESSGPDLYSDFLGLWAFLPTNQIRWSVHTCLLPCAWGQAIEATRAMLVWLWENSPCQRIVTEVPDGNRLALRLAKQAGMEFIGIDRKSIMKGGKLQDQILLGLSKPCPAMIPETMTIEETSDPDCSGDA